GRPSAQLANNAHERPEIFASYQQIMPHQPFPGAGGMPIIKGGRVVGGIATGGGVGPYTEVPGIDPSLLRVKALVREHDMYEREVVREEVVQANAEDLVICT